MLLEGKRFLITGVLTPQSIAFAAARSAQEQGAEIVLTNFGRGVSLTERVAKRLPDPPDVMELDVNEPDHIASVRDELASRWGSIDGFLHAIAFAPADALGGNFLNTEWESVATAVRTSAFSLKELAAGMLPLMKEAGGSIVSLDFDATGRLAHLRLDGRGEGGPRVGQSLPRARPRAQGRAREHGERRAAANHGRQGHPGVRRRSPTHGRRRAPLGWDVTDPTPVGNTVAFLLSDLSKGITGEMIHVDGGFHAMGTDLYFD